MPASGQWNFWWYFWGASNFFPQYFKQLKLVKIATYKQHQRRVAVGAVQLPVLQGWAAGVVRAVRGGGGDRSCRVCGGMVAVISVTRVVGTLLQAKDQVDR